jgi:8-oxo-dGTP pyrophosphatase MutT (NUDIX family)
MSPIQNSGETFRRKLLRAQARRGMEMVPTLAYGRHRGPAAPSARFAAVAVALYQDPQGEWMIPLTLRPTRLKHHGGQVCLPGGRVERGEQIRDAAVREYEEEMGLAAEITHDCGELSTQYVYASNNLVHPVVFMINRPSVPWRPDPVEVAEVIPIPLSVLSDPRQRVAITRSRSVRRDGRVVGNLSFRTAAVRYRGHDIWGATALILEELAQILHPKSESPPA